jgi:hypothetical protein
MPLRTKLLGSISPSWAALKSAEIANEASDALLPTREWQGLGRAFCNELKNKMNEMFKGRHEGLGATVEN